MKTERGPAEGSGPPALRAPEPGPAEPPVLLASGQASWYADSLHGRRTASGERYDREEYTAAHRSLPFGARLCVRSLVNGRTVIVRVNDRGPFTPGRIIDLSRAAAEDLGMVGLGIKSVELWQVGPDDDACPDRLEQAVTGSGLGLDADAAAQALQRRAPKAAPKHRPRRKRR
ncbi:MAG: septal ring lytic transglycosylase RlpA family protein [Proteobacteria bacterium]|nr:septal ring lytic transglycosylase RlpA family protein [Pseudomonadota bacterium]